LHSRGYVIGDLNESNILVGETALVSLVDTDSFQVPDPRNGRVYRCRVGKPEFTPPEMQTIKFDWIDRKPEHDLFGLSVLLFQLLLEGIHPFAGRHTGKGEPPTLEERIATGSFPYSPARHADTLPIATAPGFEILDQRLREFFLECFIGGHSTPRRRPEAQAWQAALQQAENSLTSCTANHQHQFGKHLSSCPWCQRQQLLGGLDPFPSAFAVKRGWHLKPPFPIRRPRRVASANYETAITIALHAIARRRRQGILLSILAMFVVGCLVIHWWWAIQSAIKNY